MNRRSTTESADARVAFLDSLYRAVKSRNLHSLPRPSSSHKKRHHRKRSSMSSTSSQSALGLSGMPSEFGGVGKISRGTGSQHKSTSKASSSHSYLSTTPSGCEYSSSCASTPDRARAGSSLIFPLENAVIITEGQLAFSPSDAYSFVPIETDAERQAKERALDDFLDRYTTFGAGSVNNDSHR